MSFATTPKQVLIAAKWMLENIGWCQGWFVKNADGEPIYDGQTTNTKICSLCLMGAVERVEVKKEDLRRQAYIELLQAIKERAGEYINVPLFNDDETTTKQDVLSVLDQAIKAAP